MTQSELIAAIAEKADITKAAAEKMVKALVSVASLELKKGGTITLADFGSFVVKTRPARTGRNPKTGESLAIEAKTGAKFKPFKSLTDSLNK